MPLKVINAGLSRTGTLTLKVALERLGLGPCYHSFEFYGAVQRLAKHLVDTHLAGDADHFGQTAPRVAGYVELFRLRMGRDPNALELSRLSQAATPAHP